MMKALSYGEILFDCFPTCRRIGGAPFNVAAHIAALGGESRMIGAVGRDELGAEALSELKRLGVGTEYVSVVDEETGRADIVLTPSGDADYSFNEPAAWDRIKVSDESLEKLSSVKWDAFIFGTLASRNSVSRGTLFSLIEHIDARHFFFDVNFRKELYTPELLRRLFEKTTILKVNEEELQIVLDIADSVSIGEMIEKWNFEMVLLTLGEKGADLYTATEKIHRDAVPGTVVDTVGAGDSLSAAFLYFLSRGDEKRTALEKAGAVSSFVVSSEGAVPSYPQSLRDFLDI